MLTTEPLTAKAIEANRDGLSIFIGERRVKISWDKCSKRLASATEHERMKAELSPGGYGIHWPLIDEDLSVNGLLRDHE
jgi:hypothetical protein